MNEEGKISGGIFLASNIDKSCRAWNIVIDDPGHLGSCEDKKHLLTEDIECIFEKDALFWMTDRCPHESMILSSDCYRQWFRFVTGRVSLWYSQHSTFNPLGILPKCEIITDSKFDLAYDGYQKMA